jgi:predicted ester cyclase
MSTPHLVTEFYRRIWNSGDATAIPELLTAQFAFRGSLGVEMRGRDVFWDYVCSIRTTLHQFRCDIVECVSENEHAFAKMRFSGIHAAQFRGHRATGRALQWAGAALFEFEHQQIRALWVLGDLIALDAMLQSHATA